MSAGGSSKWCHVCGSRHELGPKCPGELLATGPERYGWKVHVLNETRRETYGVLISESDDLWRARVLTFPNMLWCVPGGRKPLKIVGRSAQEVERHARRLIEDHCKARGLKFCEDETQVKVGKIDREAAQGDGTLPKGGRDARLLQAIPVSFGERKPDRSGTTSDISKGGLFITTKRPLPKGRRVRMVLKLENASIPLAGTVMWARVKPEPERSAGMGIRLIAPPALYQHYVRELTREADAGPGDDVEEELDFEFDFSATEQ